MSNTVISKWLGECPHDPPICEICCGDCPNFENDESAWTQELYGRIETANLTNMFITFLMGSIVCAKVHRPKKLCFDAISKPPAQKAAALSRAITEQEAQ